jgi:hypothetical protein
MASRPRGRIGDRIDERRAELQYLPRPARLTWHSASARITVKLHGLIDCQVSCPRICCRYNYQHRSGPQAIGASSVINGMVRRLIP